MRGGAVRERGMAHFRFKVEVTPYPERQKEREEALYEWGRTGIRAVSWGWEGKR
jgi:hypothetical protein